MSGQSKGLEIQFSFVRDEWEVWSLKSGETIGVGLNKVTFCEAHSSNIVRDNNAPQFRGGRNV